MALQRRHMPLHLSLGQELGALALHRGRSTPVASPSGCCSHRSRRRVMANLRWRTHPTRETNLQRLQP